MEKQIVSIVVRPEKFLRMLACLTAHCHELKCNNVDLSRINGCEIIREAKIFTATLFDRLSRKIETKPFRCCVVFVNDQVVTARLTRKITVDKLGFEQPIADRLGFKPLKTRINLFLKDSLILLRRSLSLFELPLTFE